MTSQMYLKGDFVRDGDQLVSTSWGQNEQVRCFPSAPEGKAVRQVWLGQTVKTFRRG